MSSSRKKSNIPRNCGESGNDVSAFAPSIPGSIRGQSLSLKNHKDAAVPDLVDENAASNPQIKIYGDSHRVTGSMALMASRRPNQVDEGIRQPQASNAHAKASSVARMPSNSEQQAGRSSQPRYNDDAAELKAAKERILMPSVEHDVAVQERVVQPGAVRVGHDDLDSHYRQGKRFELEINADVETPEGEEQAFAGSSGEPHQEHSNVGHGNTVTAYTVDEPKLVHAESIETEKRICGERRLVLAGIAVVVVIIAVVVPVVVVTGNSGGGEDSGSLVFSAIVSDLCSPRHLKIHDETLFVSEAGVGPVPIPEDPVNSEMCLQSTLFSDTFICYGDTGRISSYDLDGTSRGDPPLTGLFSARNVLGRGTSEVYGPASVDFDDDGNMFTLLGLGYINATELNLRSPDLVFASVLMGAQAVATPWVPLYEFNYNNVSQPESNPFHMCMHDGITYVVDAGADTLYTYRSVELAGTMEPDSVVRLPRIEDVPAVPANPRGGPCNDVTPPRGPFFCGQYQDEEGNWFYRVNPVPTAVRINPNDPSRIYVSYLAGAIWSAPVSGIFFMDLVDGIPQVDTVQMIRGEFWSIVDFDFHDNDVFVLETFPGGSIPFAGRLSKVQFNPDTLGQSVETIMENIVNPAGLLIHEDMMFLSNNTFNAAMEECNGEILRAEL